MKSKKLLSDIAKVNTVLMDRGCMILEPKEGYAELCISDISDLSDLKGRIEKIGIDLEKQGFHLQFRDPLQILIGPVRFLKKSR